MQNYMLSYYKNAVEGIHVQKISESKAASKPHTHDFFQIYYVSKGSINHYVGVQSSLLTRGNMFIIPPGTPHHMTIGEDPEIYTFSFLPDIFEKSGDGLPMLFLKALAGTQQEGIHSRISVPADELLRVESIMEQMLKEFNKKALGYTDTLKAYGVLLLTIFARVYFETLPEKFRVDMDNSRQAILYGIAYMDAHFTEPITIEDMARRCAMSRSGFCSLFAEITGMTFRKYLNACRIDYAIRLMQKGYKITSLYGLCGYRDFSTFYRNFKSITGLSPEQYRRAEGGNS